MTENDDKEHIRPQNSQQQGTHEELGIFIDVLNTNVRNIKLTYKCERQRIDFLDISIMVGNDGTVYTDLFRKETSVNSLLHSSSQHPYHLIKNIPTGQFLRARRICSSNELFEKQAQDLCVRFKDRGYGKKTICHSYQRALCSQRITLLQKHKKDKNPDQVRCVLDFHSRSEDVRRAINKYWSVLMTDRVLAKCMGPRPFITFRRSPNLKDQLVHSYHKGPDQKFIFGAQGPKWGCTSCGKCLACSNVDTASDFSNSKGNKNYQITHTITCTTRAVIYHATCPCGLIYVGMTTREFRRRVREHVLDIEGARMAEDPLRLQPIPRHFKALHGCDPSGLRIKGIDRVFIGQRGGNWKRMLAQREARWIYKLDTIMPLGLNDHNSYAPFLPWCLWQRAFIHRKLRRRYIMLLRYGAGDMPALCTGNGCRPVRTGGCGALNMRADDMYLVTMATCVAPDMMSAVSMCGV
ncbi:unnamed protein product [Ranitomeya imitator]|uniref:Helix-turn-helix domain-containing protein n=1 Tax=Ranitomeya imitator TaxID=111125 RepID=A0ABN9KTR1_9NEOB|nr:unnamed protein product [Ranitomeya imitator]